MNMQHARSGYILITTLLMLTAGVSVVTYLITRATSYVPLIDVIGKQEKARMLAFAGLQIAAAQLATPPKQKEGEQEKPKAVPSANPNLAAQKGAADDSRHLASIILPTLNRWQQFKLKESIEGIDGILNISVSCEDGKINLNQIYDFEKKEFRGEKQKDGGWRKILKDMCGRIEKQMGGKELFENVENYLKKRVYQLNDVTELLVVPGFIIFSDKIFYEPPSIDTNKGGNKEARPLYLNDIFTLYTQKYTIDPWVFSDSLAGLLELKRAESGDREQREKMVETVLKQFKKTANWKADWKQLLQPLYQKELQSLPSGIESVLGTTFDPRVFSIVVHATVDSVTQRLYAIVERIQQDGEGAAQTQVQIRKVYWL